MLPHNNVAFDTAAQITMKTATYRRIITAVEGWYRGESVGVKQSDAPIERKSEDDGYFVV